MNDAPGSTRRRRWRYNRAFGFLCLGLIVLELYVFSALARSFFHLVGRAFTVHTVWIPILLVLWAAVCVRRRWIGWLAAGGSVLLALLLAGAGGYATRVEPRRLTLREVRLESARITQPLRILHISDIQSAGIGLHEIRAFERMARLNPDLVIHTGDLIQVIPPADPEAETQKLLALFRTLHPPLGIWHVHGDTDWRLVSRPDSLLDPVRVLRDAPTSLSFPGGTLDLFGLSLPESGSVSNAPPAVSAWASASPGLRILFGHNPNFILWARNLDIDLCLAGHTHGGQIRLPLFGPLLTLSEVPRDKARGWYRFGRPWVNVSAGIGGEHAAGLPTIRVNCPPEMTLISVVPSPAAVVPGVK